MNKFITFAMMLVLSLSALAQTETTRMIHGAVIDKNGNPLPGAVISADGGADTSIAESDGTFSMEVPIWLRKVSASYGGYKKQTLKTDFGRDMIFRLSKKAPTPGGYFINVSAGGVFDTYGEGRAYTGIRGGHLANLGWYGEIGYDFLGQGIQAIVGGIRRIYNSAFFYLGVGYGRVTDSSYEDLFEYFDRYNGFAIDGGFQFIIAKHIDFSVGVTYTTEDFSEHNFTPKITVGYVF